MRRMRLTLEEKYQLIQDHERGISANDLRNKYKCGKNTVYGIIKKKAEIQAEYQSAQNVQMKNKMRRSRFELVNKLTFEWLKYALSEKLPIDFGSLRKKACEIAAANNFHDFKASNRWFESFKLRHQLTMPIIGSKLNIPNQEKILEQRNALDENIKEGNSMLSNNSSLNHSDLFEENEQPKDLHQWQNSPIQSHDDDDDNDDAYIPRVKPAKYKLFYTSKIRGSQPGKDAFFLA